MDQVSDISRRGFLGGVGALLVLAACSSNGGKTASSSSTSTTGSGGAAAKPGWRSLPLSSTPDANGLLLPEGFTSRVVATTGQPVGDTGYVWPLSPDGAATFADREVKGGWYHAVNSEAAGRRRRRGVGDPLRSRR